MTATVNGSVHAGIAVYAVLFVAAVLAARWWNTPVRDIAPHGDDHDTVITPIDELMGVWEREQERGWEPVYGVALEQARGGRS